MPVLFIDPLPPRSAEAIEEAGSEENRCTGTETVFSVSLGAKVSVPLVSV